MNFNNHFGGELPVHPRDRATMPNNNNNHPIDRFPGLDGANDPASQYGQVPFQFAGHRPQHQYAVGGTAPQSHGLPNSQQRHAPMPPRQSFLPITFAPTPAMDMNSSNPEAEEALRRFNSHIFGTPMSSRYNPGSAAQLGAGYSYTPLPASSPYIHGSYPTYEEETDDATEEDDEDDSQFEVASDEIPTPKKGKASAKSVKKQSQNKSKKPKKQASKPPPQPVATITTIAPYAEDAELATPAQCRALLACPSDAHQLDVPGDDWEDVRDNHRQEFIGQIYDVLLSPYTHDPPQTFDFVKSKGFDFDRYCKQQDEALVEVGELLGTPNMVKRAKANCTVLVDRVLFVHSNGVSEVKWNGHEFYNSKGRKVTREYRLEFVICSERLNRIVEAVRENKRVAVDVLTGKHDHLAEAPRDALSVKFVYAGSNTNRQKKVDTANEREEGLRLKGTSDTQNHAKARATRGKQIAKKRKAVSEDEAEDDQSGFEVITPMKTRASSGKKKAKHAVVDGDED